MSTDFAQLNKKVEDGLRAQRLLAEIGEPGYDVKRQPMIGRCFVYENTRGRDGERWPLYRCILSTSGLHCEQLQFQVEPNGAASVEIREGLITGGPKWKPISQDAFRQAWQQYLGAISIYALRAECLRTLELAV